MRQHENFSVRQDIVFHMTRHLIYQIQQIWFTKEERNLIYQIPINKIGCKINFRKKIIKQFAAHIKKIRELKIDIKTKKKYTVYSRTIYF